MTLGVADLLLARREPRALLSMTVGAPDLSILLVLARLGDIHTAASRMAATTFGPLWLAC